MKRFLVSAVLLGSACTGETAVPIDLDSTTSIIGTEDGAGGGQTDQSDRDPNAEQNRITIGYAEQQCLDDPELKQGYVQIVDPATQTKVGEVTVDCAQVRDR